MTYSPKNGIKKKSFAMALMRWYEHNFKSLPHDLGFDGMCCQLEALQMHTIIDICPRPQIFPDLLLPLRSNPHEPMPVSASFVCTAGIGNKPGHAWAFAMVQDLSGDTHLLIYDCDFPKRDNVDNLRSYLYVYPDYRCLIDLLVVWTARCAKPGSVSSVWVNQDDSWSHQDRCLELSVHWLRSLAAYGDRPLVHGDLRLDGFVLCEEFEEDKAARWFLPGMHAAKRGERQSGGGFENVVIG